MPVPPQESKRTSRVILIVTLVVSAGCLVWWINSVNWHELLQDVRELDWRWVAVAAVADVLVYVLQGWRWALVLRPVAPVSYWSSIGAIFVGLFANEVQPLHAGELIRCFVMARWSKIPISVTMASALIERIFDGILLIAGLFFSLRYVARFHLTRAHARAIGIITDGSISLAVLIIVGAVLLAIAMYWREQTLDTLLDARLFSWAHVFIEDLHRIGHSRYLYFAAAVSIPYLLLQILPVYALMQAYGFDSVAWAEAATLMLFLRLGGVLPQAPGNIGLFQVVSTVVLTMFGASGDLARRFAGILFAGITVPLLVVGLIALVATGVKMGDIQREAQAEIRARQEELSSEPRP
ncbi:MAG TPA: lysylphosphatidylglycerol synthase transmembrane domain-containing protein [Bryobacteraceae bacterium]|nr:lysylphosphatidylglycerol synthase transmembrane domain-containing protein [Bryobacteraceae bacterium]